MKFLSGSRHTFLLMPVLFVLTLVFASQGQAGQIITNGTFGNPPGTSLTGWTVAGSGSHLLNTPGQAQGFVWDTDSSSSTLTQTGIKGWNVGSAPSGAAQLTFDIGWNNGVPDADVAATLTVRVGGVTYLTITSGTPSTSTYSATLTYQNSATGTPATITTPTANAYGSWQGVGETRTVTINLPATVAATGDLVFSYNAGTGGYDDFFIANVSAQSKRPTVLITKQSIGGTGSFTFTGTNGWASQTISTATVNPNMGMTQTLTAAATATTITETPAAGFAITAISCSGLGSGTATPNLAAGSVKFDTNATAAANSISCTFVNTRPTVAIQKISVGGTGTFSFSGATNLASVPAAIATTAPGTAEPVSPAAINVTTVGTAVTVTEQAVAGYALTAASCTDANSAVTGSSGSFGALAGNVLTIPAANIKAGAAITCVFTNTKLPTLQVLKISNGATGTFSFSGSNGFGSDSISTTTAGTAANGAIKTLTAAATATTVTETIPPTYFVQSISCTGLGAGAATPNLSGGSVALDATATAPGNAIVCTFTNTKEDPALSLVKTSNISGPVVVGQVITYTYTVSNTGNRNVANVQINETFNGTGSTPTPKNEALVTDAAPLGDSTDTTANNGVWTTLGPGDVVKFTANYTVTQADIDTLQ